MKQQALNISLFIAVFAMITSCGVGYVATTPEASVYVETPPPFVGAVWMGPEYRWTHHHYEPRPGHWEHPREGRNWEQGHWEHTPRGHYWQGGRWK